MTRAQFINVQRRARLARARQLWGADGPQVAAMRLQGSMERRRARP
jgi:hypothetical protein